LRLEICPNWLSTELLVFRAKFRGHELCLFRKASNMAILTRHSFAIERLARRPGWFKPDRYRYYCIRCHWMFLVEGRRVCALSESCHPLSDPENGGRVASFAVGPCPAMPPECVSAARGIPATKPHQKIATVLPSTPTSGQSRATTGLKSVSSQKTNVA